MNGLAKNGSIPPPEAWWLLRRLVVTAATLGAVVIASGVAPAQGAKLTPPQVRLLILYNFAKFTEWPKTAFAHDRAPFVVGVLGKDPFGQSVSILRDKKIRGRELEIRRFTVVEELTECHLLYISSSEMSRLPRILKRLENSNILTTAEVEGFIEQKGIINLVREPQPNGTETVGFEVNLLAAEKANLKLDPELLRLAKRKIRS